MMDHDNALGYVTERKGDYKKKYLATVEVCGGHQLKPD